MTTTSEGTASKVHDFKMRMIDGSEKSLSDYKGKVLLIVNVASKCGLTPQYDALEKIYKQYKAQGFEVLGFPANEFAGQEPGSNAEIQQFCRSTYGVDFPMFEKIVVKGQKIHPLYSFLIHKQPHVGGAAGGTDPSEVSWNFEKFLVNKNGDVVARFSPKTVPDDASVIQAIESELKKQSLTELA